MGRHQQVLFSTTLDAAIGEDHPVRVFDELLAVLDWRAWESQYVQVAGQPAIHPRVVAGVILYGLSQGLRSSRRLEWACGNAVDFMWLAEGRRIDHSTFCEFRTRFTTELKGLFRDLAFLARGLGLVRLNQVAIDGTAIRASSSRHGTRQLGSLQEELAELDARIEQMFAEAERADACDTDLFGQDVSPNHLPKELADVKARQRKLRAAVEAAKARGATDKTRVGLADPEAAVSPNKEGGFAPNYVPLAAVDAQAGLIVAAAVADRPDEGSYTVALVEQAAADLEQMPQQVLADSKHGTGNNLRELTDRGVEPFMPQEQRKDGPGNPARREDPQIPVASELVSKLPRNARTKKFDRAAFVYDPRQDCYWCPQGRRLAFRCVQHDRGSGTLRRYRVYQCDGCGGCPLPEQCLSGAQDRMVSRDENELLREEMDARLSTPAGEQTYRRRSWIAETPFALMKSWMGLRQFLLRGWEKVKTEWLWCCTGYNLKKLVGELARIRAALRALA